MRNPYLIQGPAAIQFSGGRTSGYLLKHILEAHGGKLPDDVKVAFQNTGKEKSETLDFVRDCQAAWSVPIVWLEYRYDPPAEEGGDSRHYYEIVNYNSASRRGEPFEQLIRARSFLPNPASRFCSIEMKIRTCYRWVRAELGWDHWDAIIGLRADEPRRVAKAKTRNEAGKDRFSAVMPLAVAGVSKTIVRKFWEAQSFDLRLININGTTPDGNCDNCFLKGFSLLQGRARRDPESFAWWIEQELEAKRFAKKASGAVFRQDRPNYAGILKLAVDQPDIIGDESNVDCACTD